MKQYPLSKEIDTFYTPPELKEIHVHYRKDIDKYLVINPLGPNWFVTNKDGITLIKLCNGEISIGNMLSILEFSGMKINKTLVINFFSLLNKIRFFDEGDETSANLLDAVFLNITGRCNLNCVYCYYDSNSKANSQKKEIPTNNWINILKQIQEINPKCVPTISGGEPFLSDSLFPILDKLDELKLKSRIYTNGTLIKHDSIQKLKKYQYLDYVQISLDSLEKKENIKTRTIDPAKTIDSILMLKSAGIPVLASCTVTNVNSNSIPSLIEFFKKNEIKHRFVLYFPTPGRAIENISLYRADNNTMSFLSQTIKVNDSLNMNIIKGYKRLQKRTVCGFSKVLSISESGYVYPCNHLYLDDFIMGDAKKEPLIDIITKSKSSFHPISVNTFEDCKNCELRYICGGTCRATGYHENGKLNTRSSECGFMKNTILNALWEQSLIQSEKNLLSDKWIYYNDYASC